MLCSRGPVSFTDRKELRRLLNFLTFRVLIAGWEVRLSVYYSPVRMGTVVKVQAIIDPQMPLEGISPDGDILMDDAGFYCYKKEFDAGPDIRERITEWLKAAQDEVMQSCLTS